MWWGGDSEAVRLETVAVYTVSVGAACFWLAGVHHGAWKRTGRRSDMLKLEAQASVYDGVITVFAGVGLLSTPFMKATWFEPLAPVMDSIMVLILCSIAILSYFRAFRKGMAQLAGAPASPADQLAVWHALRRAVAEESGDIIDIALVRVGRKLDAVVYYNPNRAVTADGMRGNPHGSFDGKVRVCRFKVVGQPSACEAVSGPGGVDSFDLWWLKCPFLAFGVHDRSFFTALEQNKLGPVLRKGPKYGVLIARLYQLLCLVITRKHDVRERQQIKDHLARLLERPEIEPEVRVERHFDPSVLRKSASLERGMAHA